MSRWILVPGSLDHGAHIWCAKCSVLTSYISTMIWIILSFLSGPKSFFWGKISGSAISSHNTIYQKSLDPFWSRLLGHTVI